MANRPRSKFSDVFDGARHHLGIPDAIDPSNFPNILSVFEQAVTKFRHKPAFSCLGHILDFGEVDELSGHFAAFLTGHCQLKPGDRLAVQLPNVLQYPVVVFGAIKAGVIVVNTNPLYTHHEMEHQFNDSGAVAIVVLANMASKVEQVLPNTFLRHVIVTELADLHPAPKRQLLNFAVKYIRKMVPDYNLPTSTRLREALQVGQQYLQRNSLAGHRASADDVAVLQYTGGTTGIAKGAMLTHGNLVANMLQVYPVVKMAGIAEGDVFVAPLPLYHIYAFMLHCMTAFSLGCHSILIPNPRDIPGFVKTLRHSPFTVMVGLNTLFIALMNNPLFRQLDFSKLRITISGGMALSGSVAVEWQQLTGREIVEGYGLTEASPVVTLNPPGRARVGTIGVPLPATELRLVDDTGKECMDGEQGELCVAGPQVMKGYWQRPEATADAVVDGWLHTGDVALVLPDGYVKIVDRKKDMILVSGFNVYPNELEDVANAHPDVLESAAIGVPDEHSGEAVKLFVVRKSESLTVEILQAWCAENLTGYKRPRYIEFRQELPKSNVGKILRRELRGKTA